MKDNPLRRLQDFGQSVWLDDLHRGLLESGELAQLIEEDGLRGVTSNPAIFDKAFSRNDAYDEAIRDLARRGRDAGAIYEAVTVEDVRRAADLLRTVHDTSGGRHGFVSLEVNPHLARDTDGTIEEARRLWAALDRPNVFIKVPATEEGLPAIQQLIADGINVNVTLLFGLERYRRVAEAYIAGLERQVAGGRPPRAASVASFFLSRLDVLVDRRLTELAAEGGERGREAAALRGKAAVAAARLAYRRCQEIFSAERFRKLAVQQAQPQRLLWASTGTKSPDEEETKYIEPLIGPETITTMPMATLAAYREHGRPAARLESEVEAADGIFRQLAALGVDMEQVSGQLEEEGIDKFIEPYDRSLATLQHKAAVWREPVA